MGGRSSHSAAGGAMSRATVLSRLLLIKGARIALKAV